ncbi:MAG: GDSL-type esterase/lipase family protein [Coraliomargarita sp.]
MRFRLRFFWLCGLLAVGGLIVAEIVLRVVVGLGTPPLFQVDETIEYLYQPSQNVKRFGNQFYVNRYSMRADEFSEVKEGAELRVLCLGDSILDGGALLDQSELATVKLQEMLSADCAVPVVVGNASAKSWGPGNWLAYLQRNGAFDADIVVIVISSHDLKDEPTFAPLNPNTHPTERPLSAFSEAFSRYLPRYLPFLASNAPKDHGVELSDEELCAAAYASLSSIIEWVDQQGAQVVVLSHVTRSELRAGEKKSGGLLIEGFMREQGVLLMDTLPFYEKALMAERELYLDSIHLNAEGHAALALALQAAVASVANPESIQGQLR